MGDADGRLPATADGDTLRVGRCRDKLLLHAFGRSGQAVEAIRFSPDGRFPASGSTGGGIQIRRCADWQLHGELQAGDFPHDLSFSPDSQRLAIGGSDEAVIIVTIAAATVERRLRGRGWMQTIASSADGERVVAGTNSGGLYCWGRKQRELVTEKRGTAAIGALRVAGNRCFSRSEHSARVRRLTDDHGRSAADPLQGWCLRRVRANPLSRGQPAKISRRSRERRLRWSRQSSRSF